MAPSYQQILPQDEETGGRSPSEDAKSSRSCLGPGLCALLLLVIVVGALWCFTCRHAAMEFVTIKERTWNVTYEGSLVTPDNISYKVYPGFMFLGHCASDSLLQDFYRSSRDDPWSMVRFPSRRGDAGQETAELSAWWYPATGAESTPAVVLVHGYGVSANDQSVQLAGHLLRSLGIATLLLHLRNHGLSGNTSTMYETFGWAYHLDVLGAWDYVVADPEGMLGGPRQPAQVGILGFSMGGFAVANAFGLEGRVPGAWLDSALFDPKEELRVSVAKVTGQVLASLGINLAWQFAHSITAVDVDLRLPATSLALRQPARRPVAVVANKLDRTVGIDNARHYLKAFDQNSASYKVAVEYLVESVCTPRTHVNIQWWRPDSYRQRLWDFWKEVFALNRSMPSGLVHFEQCETVQCP